MRSRYPRLVEAPDVAPLPGARLQVLDERAPGWRIVSWGSWSRCTAQQPSLAPRSRSDTRGRKASIPDPEFVNVPIGPAHGSLDNQVQDLYGELLALCHQCAKWN